MTSDLVYLAKTDTTVGFLSSNAKKLNSIKKRAENKPLITACSTLMQIKSISRVQKRYKKLIRNSKKTTFILPRKTISFRLVANDKWHSRFVEKFGCLYTTSANESGHSYDEKFAFEHSDIIVNNPNGLNEDKASKMLILQKRKLKKIRD